MQDYDTSLAAVMGGAQSLHTNGYDEALSLYEEAAKNCFCARNKCSFESGVPNTKIHWQEAFVESLTDEVEKNRIGQ
jgi:methylmalonyl-CoA mutase N-terminal domain/subunit